MRKLIYILLCFSSTSAYSQITGKVIDSNDQAIPFVNVLVLQESDSTFITGVVTEPDGSFIVSNIMPGRYFLRFSTIGFVMRRSGTIVVSSTGTAYDLGSIRLEEDAQQLDAIIIKDEKLLFEQNVDRTVVNVQNSVLTKGSSALEVIERLPGVYIDRNNSNIVLQGKGGVTIMVNGKLMRMPVNQLVSWLNGLSANTIEKIELLPTPPARYDAEGSAGMINIVLKRNEDLGTQGSVSLTGGYGWREKSTGSLNLAHNTGKISVYGDYTFSHDNTFSRWFGTSTQDMPAFGGSLDVVVSSSTEAVSNNHNAIGGMDVILGKTTLGGTLAYNSSEVHTSTNNLGDYTLVEEDSLLQMNAKVNGVNRWQNYSSGLYLQHAISADEKIKVDADYLHYTNSNPTDVFSIFSDRDENEVSPNGNIFSSRQRGSANTGIHVGVLKMDYEKTLSEKLKLEAGVKGTYTRSTSVSAIESFIDGAWEGSPRTSSDIDMRETILAGYSSFRFQPNASTTLVTEARYEYSHTHMDAVKVENNIDRRLGKLFPGFSVTRKTGEDQEVQFSYSKRISRPSYNDLASFMTYTDPMSVFTGNPALRPTITNNLKAGYTINGYAFSLLASRDEFPIARYQLDESIEGDIMYVAPQNMRYQNSLTFQTTIPVKITPWWSMTHSITTSLRKFGLAHTDEKREQQYIAYSFNGSHTLTLPSNFFLEISGWYNSFQYDGSKKLNGFGMMSAGIKKELKGNSGTIQLSVADIFRSMRIINRYGHLTREAFNIKSRITFEPESARASIVKLTYSRSFGNTRMKTERQRGQGTREERDRVRKE